MMKILAVVAVMLLAACQRRDCGNPAIRAIMWGYDSTELKGMMVKKYLAGSGFATLLEVDTLNPKVFNNQSEGVLFTDRAYDYRIEVPKLGETHEITNIGFGNDEYRVFFINSMMGGEAEKCANSVGYIMDGEHHSAERQQYCKDKSTNCSITIKVLKK
ncbi:MAG TPA: hypothetical protein PL009_13190 [Flavipsychrobacter sp.]|nr:hypothetical protein [Flavipsychrobacter sp.]